MQNKTHFYDPLYDFVTFEEAEEGVYDELEIFHSGFSDSIQSQARAKQILPFLSTFEFNRLNFLRQSGFTFLVYPSSTHTRFSHSIGSCYLGFIACGKIMIQSERKIGNKTVGGKLPQPLYLSEWLDDKSRQWREEFLLALLLHDVGHFPFSHTLESNLEFWQCFKEEERVSHEDLACQRILGLSVGSQSDDDYRDFKKHVGSKLDLGQLKDQGYKFVSDLIDRTSGIDKKIVCYFISGHESYLSHIGDERHLELRVVHELVSGLLDLDRIDHLRRDSYFSGLKFGSNLNFAGLLGGMTLHYYSGGSKTDYELRLSPTAIGHALTLLHSKERLIHDCFEDWRNLAYDAMLHQAINLYMGIDKIDNRKFTPEEVKKAYGLFFLTDDELLAKLSSEESSTIREIVFRIQNRMPYIFVGKMKVSSKKYTIEGLREKIIGRTGLSGKDVILRASKSFGSPKRPSDEWLDLDYLFNERGDNLVEIPDYTEQIKYFKQVQTQSPDVVWFFTPQAENKDMMKDAIDEELQKTDKE